VANGRAALLAVIPACAVLYGCGGNSDIYAGLSEDRATKEARIFVEQELRERTSPLHRHRVRMGDVRRGQNLFGKPAWVARFSDLTTKSRFCLRLRASGTKTLHAEFDRCHRTAPAAPPKSGDRGGPV